MGYGLDLQAVVADWPTVAWSGTEHGIVWQDTRLARPRRGPDGKCPVGASLQVRSGKIVNPGVLKGFNPQPEPPARTPAKP